MGCGPLRSKFTGNGLLVDSDTNIKVIIKISSKGTGVEEASSSPGMSCGGLQGGGNLGAAS